MSELQLQQAADCPAPWCERTQERGRHRAGTGQAQGGSAGAAPTRSPRLGGFGGAVPGPFPRLLPPRAPPGGPARTHRGSSAAGREERERVTASELGTQPVL